MSQKDDLRVRRTQQMLRQAFIELVCEEGFAALTVQQLAERAMINRATFYRHFEDKYDLAEKVYTALTDEYIASIETNPSDDPLAAWRLMFEHMAAYANFYRALLAGMPHFRDRVRGSIERQLHAGLLARGLDEAKIMLPLGLILRYLATAQMGIVQWWLEAGQPISAAEMAQHLRQLHLSGGIQLLQLPSTR